MTRYLDTPLEIALGVVEPARAQCMDVIHRVGNLSPARWVSPTNPKLGLGWALIFLARKNQAKFSPARLARWAK